MVVCYQLAGRQEKVRLGMHYWRPFVLGETELVGEVEERSRGIRGSLITWRPAVWGWGGCQKGKEVARLEKAQGLA